MKTKIRDGVFSRANCGLLDALRGPLARFQGPDRIQVLLKLGKDELGSILVQFTITLVVIMGIIGLALDGGRLMMLNSDLQKLADAAALAGAAELNGAADALTRADSAARSVANQNNVHWWDVAAAANILAGTSGVQFYSSLNPDTVTTNPKAAGYIKVTTTSWQVAPSFLVPTGVTSNGATTANAWAKGLAASGPHGGGAVCLPQAMMLCNPLEPAGGGTGDASNFNSSTVTPGQMFIFSTTGNSSFAPGDFNLIDTLSGSGADQDIARFLSQQTLDSCGTGGTNPAQGQKANATANGIDVRFDQTPSGQTSGYDLTSAPIKIGSLAYSTSGNGAPKCNQAPNPIDNSCITGPSQASCPNTSYPLPLDRNLPRTSATTGLTARGSGPTLADLQAYWSNHHSAPYPSGATTRYALYLAENAGVTWTTDGTEPHGPVCLPTSTAVPPASRRVLHVAVVDCVYWGVNGNSVNNIPINRYADFFITHPASQGASNPAPNFPPSSIYGVTTPGALSQNDLWHDGQIYVEFIQTYGVNQGELAGGGGGGGSAGSGINSIVQLVR